MTEYERGIKDADDAIKRIGDDSTVRRCRQAVLALVGVKYDPDHVMPTPEWMPKGRL